MFPHESLNLIVTIAIRLVLDLISLFAGYLNQNCEEAVPDGYFHSSRTRRTRPHSASPVCYCRPKLMIQTFYYFAARVTQNKNPIPHSWLIRGYTYNTSGPNPCIVWSWLTDKPIGLLLSQQIMSEIHTIDLKPNNLINKAPEPSSSSLPIPLEDRLRWKKCTRQPFVQRDGAHFTWCYPC